MQFPILDFGLDHFTSQPFKCHGWYLASNAIVSPALSYLEGFHLADGLHCSQQREYTVRDLLLTLKLIFILTSVSEH